MKQNGETEWEPCSPGVLHEAAIEKMITRRRALEFVGIGFLIVAIVGGTSWSIVTSNRSAQELPIGLTCSDVQKTLVVYAKNNIQDVELKSKVTAHLVKCKNCSNALDKIVCSSKFGCRPKPPRVTIKPCASEYPPLP